MSKENKPNFFKNKLNEESRTLVDLLTCLNVQQPHDNAFVFLDGNDLKLTRSITYHELHISALKIALKLKDMTNLGDRVLLIYPSGLEFIIGFFGCLYAGLIAVPIYPPRMKRGSYQQLQAVFNNATPNVVLSESTFRNLEQNLKEAISLDIPWIFTDELINNELMINANIVENLKQNINHKSLALLQYTSGSTGAPKGVMVTHENLLHNQKLIMNSFGHHEKTIVAGWLPFYHDMGLIGNILQPIYIGRPCVLMSPMTFLQRPYNWLKAISDYKITTSGGPSFAYDLCVKKITEEQKETLDLGSWEVAFNGSEPVRAEVINKFSNYFKSCHFKKRAFYPCYGMAEATLFVTGGSKQLEPIVKFIDKAEIGHNNVTFHKSENKDSIPVVSSGNVSDEKNVIIVSPEEGLLCTKNKIGEIWIRGKSIAKGYWNNPKKTKEIFRAYLKDSNETNFNSNYYLRTGDLGFIYENKLYVTGRLKELIIIRGRNYYPHDIETVLKDSHPILSLGNVAAISVEVNGNEHLVILQEIERTYIKNLPTEEIISAIQGAVSKEFDLAIFAILLLKPGQIPKTSSGKIKRFLCAQKFLEGTFETIGAPSLQTGIIDDFIGQSPIPQEVEHLMSMENLINYFVVLIASTLKINKLSLSPDQEIDKLGIDSLYAATIQNKIENDLKIDWSITRLLQGGNIKELAEEALKKIILKLKQSLLTSSQTSLDSLNPNDINSVNSKNPVISELLSYNQKAIWFAHQAAGKNSAYHLSINGRFFSEIDINVWKLAWNKLLYRHPVLRSHFFIDESELKQEVSDKINYERYGSIINIASNNANKKASKDKDEIFLRMCELANQKFILEKEFPIRVHLFISQDENNENSLQNYSRFEFLLTIHHIASDLTSILILIKEFCELYNHYISSAELGISDLTDVSYHYFDYINAQKQYIKSNQYLEDWTYWKNQLSGEMPIIKVPTDFERTNQNYQSEIYQFSIDSQATATIKNATRESGNTLFTYLLSIFYLMIYRMTSLEDIIIGSPVAGRKSNEHQKLVGCMMNVIPLRIKLSEEITLKDLLNRVRETVIKGLDHQSFPFQQMLEKTQTVRSPIHTPIFQILFALQDLRELTGLSFSNENQLSILQENFSEIHAKMKLGHLTFDLSQFPKNETAYELSFVIEPIEDKLRVNIEYAKNLFSHATIERMALCYYHLLQNSLNSFDEKIVTIPMISKNDFINLTKKWNNNFKAYPINYSIPQLFSEKFTTFGTSLAISCPKGEITYQEIELRSNQIAHYLIDNNISNSLIAVLLDRTSDMVIAILGILKSGNAYLPLDHAIPVERTNFILKDANVKAAITTEKWSERLISQLDTIISLDTDPTIFSESRSNRSVNIEVSKDSVAYVIYTSGSTGKPKGVSVTHQSILNLLYAMQEHLLLTPSDVWLAVTTLIFDISVLELFLPLLIGAKIKLIDNDKSLDGQYLSDLLDNSAITIMQATPSTWRLLISAGWKGNAKLKVLVGGEALTFNLAQELLERSGSCWNVYGPTEATIWATIYKITQDQLSKFTHLKYVPIGRPLNNLKIYILDKFLQPVPVGITGELYIGGIGVAKNYLNRDSLTRERFLDNPFEKEFGERIYKTGDLAYYLADGTIVFLGRSDNQLKIRGHRIELDEIEICLMSHTDISEAAVVAIDNSEIGTILVAFIVIKDSSSLNSVSLNASLAEKLPSYMLPSIYQFVNSLVYTNNNKIDRKALMNFDIESFDTGIKYEAPQTEEEKILILIWKKVLKREKISIHDNFFQLGGHSLIMIQVLNLLKNDYQIVLPLHDFFNHTTVKALAQRISEIRAQQDVQQNKMKELLDMVKNGNYETVE